MWISKHFCADIRWQIDKQVWVQTTFLASTFLLGLCCLQRGEKSDLKDRMRVFPSEGTLQNETNCALTKVAIEDLSNYMWLFRSFTRWFHVLAVHSISVCVQGIGSNEDESRSLSHSDLTGWNWQLVRNIWSPSQRKQEVLRIEKQPNQPPALDSCQVSWHWGQNVEERPRAKCCWEELQVTQLSSYGLLGEWKGNSTKEVWNVYAAICEKRVACRRLWGPPDWNEHDGVVSARGPEAKAC